MLPNLKYVFAGLASLTLFPRPMPRVRTTDAQALAGDWKRVGSDVHKVMRAQNGSPP